MPQTVLVTGASGFVAAHVLNVFLDAGYHVKAQVRSESSAEKVRKTHGKYGDALSFTFVEDMTAPGAFGEAVKGVDGVIHTASPFILNAKDYDSELFDPALNGTLSVLKAAKEFNPDIKRIVVTSSFASILDFEAGLRPGYTYTEADWNPMTREEAKSKDPTAAYLVSKTIAEAGAFKFVEDEKPNFDVTTICPPMVYGPLAHAVKDTKSLNTSSGDIQRFIDGSTTEVGANGFWAYVDVRDLAKAHLLGYESEKAAGQRYLVTAGLYSYQQFVDIIRAKFPDLREKVPVGTPGAPLPDVYAVDNSKSINELGLTYRSMEETVVDTVNSLLELQRTSG